MTSYSRVGLGIAFVVIRVILVVVIPLLRRSICYEFS